MTSYKSDPAKVDSQHRTMLILWFAFLSTIVIYTFLTFFVPRQQAEQGPLLTTVLNGVSIFLVGLSHVIKRKTFSRSVDTQDVRMVSTGFIVGLVLCEAAALVGLLSFMLVQDHYYLLLLGFSVFGMLLHFPRRSDLEAASFKGTHPLN